jgi:hypothetical protein
LELSVGENLDRLSSERLVGYGGLIVEALFDLTTLGKGTILISFRLFDRT